MGFLARFLGSRHGHDAHERQRALDAVVRIVGLSPQLRMVRRCDARLEPAVLDAIHYLDGVIAAIPPAREASAAGWANDPYIHAFFAAPDDIAPALSRSNDLRAFFAQNPGAQEAYGVLGMAMKEKQILGVALEGETMRRDVVQQTVSFSDHQVRVCAATETALREELVRRLVDQLGVEGLTRFAADQSRRGVLEQERALLKTRLLLLERQGVGVRAAFGDGLDASCEERARLQEQMDENAHALEGLGIRSEALERELAQLCAVLSEPGAHIYVESRRYRLNKMNVVQAEHSQEAGDDITVQVARIPTNPPVVRAFALVRFARAGLLPATSLLDQAARLLV
jgi:hypothetical protein